MPKRATKTGTSLPPQVELELQRLEREAAAARDAEVAAAEQQQQRRSRAVDSRRDLLRGLEDCFAWARTQQVKDFCRRASQVRHSAFFTVIGGGSDSVVLMDGALWRRTAGGGYAMPRPVSAEDVVADFEAEDLARFVEDVRTGRIWDSLAQQLKSL